MDNDNPELQVFLSELDRLAQGDMQQQISMYDIGDNLGLDKSETESLAQSLYIQEFAELKTLSGGMVITVKGLKSLGKSVEPAVDGLYALTDGLILTDEDREYLNQLLTDVKNLVPDLRLKYELINELVIDIKTIEVQLLSEKPKTGVIKEVCKSMIPNLSESVSADILTKIKHMISFE